MRPDTDYKWELGGHAAPDKGGRRRMTGFIAAENGD